ncbi:unnamed protein product [Closterium sp. Naga37s-1]|nr:unnamed protein product [Closterium sp. Naga37s-1]
MPEPSAVWLVDISKTIESAIGALARANLDAKSHNGRVQLVLVTVTAGMSGSASPAHGMAGKMSFARQLQAQATKSEEDEVYPTSGRKQSAADLASPSTRPAITMHTEAAEAWERGLCIAAVKFKAQRLYISNTPPPKKASRRLFRKHEPAPIMDFPLDLLPSTCTLLIPKADKLITLQGHLNASAPSIETLLLINGLGAPSALHSFNGSRGPSPSRKGLPPLSPRGFTPRLFSPRTASPTDTTDPQLGNPHHQANSAFQGNSLQGVSHRVEVYRPGLPPSPPAVCSPSTAAGVAYSAALASGSTAAAAAAPLGSSSLSPSRTAAGGGAGATGIDPRVQPPSPRIHFRPFNVSASFASRSIKRRIPSASMRAAFVRRMLSPSAARRGRAGGADGLDSDDSSGGGSTHFFNRARGFSLSSSFGSHSGGGPGASGGTAGAGGAAGAAGGGAGSGELLRSRLQRQNSFSNLEALMAAGTCSGTFAVGSGAPLLGTGGYYGDTDFPTTASNGDAAAAAAAASAAAGAGGIAAGVGAGGFSGGSLADAVQRAARAGAMAGRGRSMIPQSEPLCLGMSAAVLMDDSDEEDEEEERESERGSERGEESGSERGGSEKAGRLGLQLNLRARPPTPPKSPVARSMASCSVSSAASIPELEEGEEEEDEEDAGNEVLQRTTASHSMSTAQPAHQASFTGSDRGSAGPSPPSNLPATPPRPHSSSRAFPNRRSPPSALSALPNSPPISTSSKSPPPQAPIALLIPSNPLETLETAFSSPQLSLSPSSPHDPAQAPTTPRLPKSPGTPTSFPSQAPTTPRLPKAFSNPNPPTTPPGLALTKSSSISALAQLPASPKGVLGAVHMPSTPQGVLGAAHMPCTPDAMQLPSTPRPVLAPLCGAALDLNQDSPQDLLQDSAYTSLPEVESPCSISSRSSSGGTTSQRNNWSNGNRHRGSLDCAARERERERVRGEEEQEEGITFVTGEFSTKYSSSSLSAWSPARSEASSASRLFRTESRTSTESSRPSTECRTFSRAEILQATDHFSPKTILTKTVLGTLHKGTLFGSTVAVKRLEHASSCEEEDFQREVSILSKVRHPHVALMMGQCPEERCIVYEHLPGGSLLERLAKTPGAKPWAPLTWHDRIRVSCELAAALVFLHCHDPPIVHGDLRPENILLDRNKRSKVGDVGIAQFVGQGEVLPETWRLSGSVGYIDPSEMQTGEVTGRSDVYALGLIILQLLLGQPNIRALHKQLMPFKRAGGAVEAAVDELMCCLDPAAGIWPRKVAERMLAMALLCVLNDAEARPDFVGCVFPELRHVGQWAEAERKRRCPGQEEKLMCPLSKTRMQDPVIAADGYTYERRCIEEWFKDSSVSPKTGKPLSHKALIPNLTILAFVNS